MKLYGLIGFPLSHSFSKGYFANKFETQSIQGCTYDTFPIPNINDFPALWASHKELQGLNVTIPYKEQVIPFLHQLSDAVQKIGAVNCIKKEKDGKLTGYNTDVIGFENSLKPLLQAHHTQALVLGTGGAAKAVQYVLEKLGIAYQVVSRTKQDGILSYEDVTSELIKSHTLVINTTPLGMYPNVDAAPALPYSDMGAKHLLYDLVYNPAETLFLQKGAAQGAATKNGHEMLILQAEASWDIWNDRLA
ncbi:shikimate dehydrogenase [Chitinophaga skermanii]|uniref:Shikimate dehydrogenase n=1 Tax=Chitinophaga skermanii TaxID=331697 RepID=A0A327Q5N1_9BACT|nr:shikimate dehydrogenase [Chitinophaga skermanii]RAI99739.1 shikimate dehydrogenase [Chitinophaga skermanii]